MATVLPTVRSMLSQYVELRFVAKVGWTFVERRSALAMLTPNRLIAFYFQ